MEEKVEEGKPFKTYEQLIEKLTVNKKLIINDTDYATRLLKEHSYYALISGYKYPFKASTGEYKKNTQIEDIYALYVFDDQVRSIILKNILMVEKHVKSLIAYAFCSEYGDRQERYLEKINYNYNGDTEKEADRLVEKLKEIVNNPRDYGYIEYQQKTYQNIPLWVMMKALTLGSVSKMYSLLYQKVQANVSREFKYIKERELVGMLDLLSRFRNVCAHNERLFDYKYQKGNIPDTYVHRHMGVHVKNYAYTSGKSDLFAVFICLKYLLDTESFNSMIDEIDSCINELFKMTHQIQIAQMLKYTGLTTNWRELKECPFTVRLNR